MLLRRRVEWVACALAALAILAVAMAWPGAAQSTAPKPVIIRDIDNGDRQELHRVTGGALVPDGRISEYWCGDVVPAGKRLVIDQLAAVARHDTEDQMMVIFRGREAGGGDRDLAFVPLSPSVTTTGGLYHTATMQVRLRLSAGMTPCFIAMRTHAFSGDVRFEVTQTGYLVDTP